MTIGIVPPELSVGQSTQDSIELTWTEAELLPRTGAGFEIQAFEAITNPQADILQGFEGVPVELAGSLPYTCTLAADVVPGTVVLIIEAEMGYDGDTVTDDGQGLLTGVRSAGTIDYVTGDCQFSGTNYATCSGTWESYAAGPTWTDVATVPINQALYVVVGLDAETAFYFRVRGADSDNDGPWSAYAQASTTEMVGSITIAARPITPIEQALMHEHGQWSELFCAIDDPATVFTALLDVGSLPASNDGVAEIAITGGAFAGSYGIALEGMTIRVGSAAGLSDLGVVRLRAAYMNGATIKIGETSDVDWISDPQAARYLTIVDEFRVWPRLLRMEGPTDSADLTGLVSYTSGSTQLWGGYDVAQETAVTNYYQALFGTVTLYWKEGYPALTDYFALHDWCYVKNDYGPLGGQIGLVVYVDAYQISLNMTALYPGPDSIMLIYPIESKFSTEVTVGQTVTVTGGGAAEVVSIAHDALLEVSAPWTSTVLNAAYHTTTLLIYMDYDVPIVDEGSLNRHYLTPSPPVVLMGGPIVIDHLSNPIDVPLSAADSYQIDGVLAYYSWRTTGGAFVDDENAVAEPTLTISQAGTYRVTCEVTPDGGDVGSGHRKIYVFDEDNPPFTLARLESCEGSVDGGGWSARLTVYGDASAIRDQAEVVLFARDHYGATRLEIAQDTQRANVVMVGYVAGETIAIDPELGTTTFDIIGPQGWLDRVMGVATAVEDTLLPPSLWTSMYALTIDRALWHLFVWRSTFALGHDLYLTGDTRRIAFLEGKLGSLISQVDQMAKQVVLARAACDRLGRMIVELEPQFIPGDERATPIVQALTTANLRSPINLQRRTVNEVARVTVSGTSWDGTTPTPLVSTKPGQVFRTHGRIDSLQNLALVDQAQCDLLARLVLANRNNPYPSVPLPLDGINRLLDVSPAMYVTVDLHDNARGLALDSLPVLIKKISYSYDPDTGEFTVDGEGEGWTDETTRLEGPPPYKVMPTP